MNRLWLWIWSIPRLWRARREIANLWRVLWAIERDKRR